MRVGVLDLLARHRELQWDSPRLANYISATVLHADHPEHVPNLYLNKGEMLSDAVFEWLRGWSGLRAQEQAELAIQIPYPDMMPDRAVGTGVNKTPDEVVELFARLAKFNFSDLALLSAAIKTPKFGVGQFTTSDAGNFLREVGVDTSNLSSALRGLATEKDVKASSGNKGGEGGESVPRKIRSVDTGVWAFTETGTRHVQDLLRHHSDFYIEQPEQHT